jgi:O-antigen/teichoic acid export membrane protein
MPGSFKTFFTHPDRRNFFIYSFGAFFLKGVSFFLLPLYTNLLTTDEFGSFDLLRTFGSVIEIIFSLGLLQLIYVEFFDKNQDSKKKFISTFISIYLVISSTLYVVTAVLLLFAGSFIFPGVSYLLVAVVLLNTYLNFFQVMLITVLKLSFRAVRVSVLQVTLGCANLILNIILVWALKQGISGIFYSSLIVTILSCFYGVYYFRKQLADFKLGFTKEELRHYLSLSLPFIPNVLSFWVMNSASRWILLAHSGLHEVGIYSVAARLTSIFEPLLIEPFLSAYTPAILKKFKEGNYTQGFIGRMIYIPVAFICAGGLLMFAGPWIIGGDFTGSILLILPLSVAFAFNLLAQSSGLVLIHTKKIKTMLWCVVAGALISVLLNLILVPEMGAMGSVIGTVSGNAVWALLIIFISFTELRKRQNLRH